MKKVLLTIIASIFTITSVQAFEATVGVSWNQSVFAAEGKEDGYNESGALSESTTEYGAFEDSYGAIFIEAGNETVAIGLSYSESLSTPTNVNEANFPGSGNATSNVSADFEEFYQLYGLVRIPLGGLYVKAGIANVEVVTKETQRSGNTYPDTDTDGYVVGIGWEHKADNGFGLRAEIHGHAFDDVEVSNNQATTGNNNVITVSEMIGLTGQISLLKTF